MTYIEAKKIRYQSLISKYTSFVVTDIEMWATIYKRRKTETTDTEVTYIKDSLYFNLDQTWSNCTVPYLPSHIQCRNAPYQTVRSTVQYSRNVLMLYLKVLKSTQLLLPVSRSSEPVTVARKRAKVNDRSKRIF